MSIFVLSIRHKQLKTHKVMKIIATFNLDTHEREFNHFELLFGNRYGYKYSLFAGHRIVDVISFD